MKHLTAIALLLLIAYGVFAASAQAAVDSSAHCRVRVADGTTGSGTLVFKGQNVAYVLTCHHVFDECKSQIVCSFQDGESFYGRLKKENGNDDLSVIAIRPPRLVPVPIGDPAKATSITVCGFGPNAGFRASTGRVIGQTLGRIRQAPCPTWIVKYLPVPTRRTISAIRLRHHSSFSNGRIGRRRMGNAGRKHLHHVVHRMQCRS
jgi:hypothetical protein